MKKKRLVKANVGGGEFTIRNGDRADKIIYTLILSSQRRTSITPSQILGSNVHQEEHN